MLYKEMIKKYYIFLLSILIEILDKRNKTKIINFFKKKLNDDKITLIDVGAHKGETIKLFSKNFRIKNIFAIEPNIEIFEILKKNFSFDKKIFIFNFGLSSDYEKKDLKVFEDTSSSTFNKINTHTNYYARKKRYFSFFSNELKFKSLNSNLIPLSDLILKNNINQIDILKIDTEGYEFKVLKGIQNDQFKFIKYIYFEHHYDLMIKKEYKFADINQFLKNKNFELKFKVKMFQRKTFEYIYEKNK